MITTDQLAAACGFTEVFPVVDEAKREISGVYCCDLLSLVMGRAPSGCAWVTVMGNQNAVAVAVLTDAACIVLAEGVQPDAAMRAKAEEQKIPVFCTGLPVFEAAKAVDDLR